MNQKCASFCSIAIDLKVRCILHVMTAMRFWFSYLFPIISCQIAPWCGDKWWKVNLSFLSETWFAKPEVATVAVNQRTGWVFAGSRCKLPQSRDKSCVVFVCRGGGVTSYYAYENLIQKIRKWWWNLSSSLTSISCPHRNDTLHLKIDVWKTPFLLGPGLC